MSAQEGGPKLCGDALAVRGDYIVTGSLLPENSLELWSIKVQHYMVCVCVCVCVFVRACVCVCVSSLLGTLWLLILWLPLLLTHPH